MTTFVEFRNNLTRLYLIAQIKRLTDSQKAHN